MTKKLTPVSRLHNLILEGKQDTNQLLATMKEAYPDFPITNRTISFHRTQLRAMGHTVARAGRNDKGTVKGPNVRTAGKPKTPAKRKAAVAKPAAKKAPAKKKVAAKKKTAAKRPVAKKPAAKKPASKTTSKTSKRGAKKPTSK